MPFRELKNMKSKTLQFLSIIFLSSLLFAVPAFSESEANEEGAEPKEEKKEEKEDLEKVLPGVVASFGSAPKGAGVEFGEQAGEKFKSPIYASIKKAGRDRCQVVVANSSTENGYSVSFSVKGKTKSGSSISGRSFSVRLKPQGSETKELSCPDAQSMHVKIRSGRRL